MSRKQELKSVILESTLYFDASDTDENNVYGVAMEIRRLA